MKSTERKKIMFVVVTISLFIVIDMISVIRKYPRYNAAISLIHAKRVQMAHPDALQSMKWFNLSIYQMILHNRTSNPNSYHQGLWGGITIKSHTLEYCMTMGSGLGNVLSGYWAARGLAYSTNLTFNLLHQCPNLGRSITYLTSEERNTFTRFLPRKTHITYVTHSNISVSEGNQLHAFGNNMLHHFGEYPYRSALQLIYYNPLFLPILITETKTALTLQSHDELFAFGVNDVVIHIRCGDVIGIKNPDYGFLTLSFYKHAIEVINFNFTSGNISNINVIVLTQTGKNSLRTWTTTQEHQYESKCADFIDKYTPHIRKLFVDVSVNFTVIGNGIINHDFYKMTFAPNYIASMSTFAQQAAFANTNNVILPNWGPWRNLAHEWVDGNNLWTPKNHKYIDVKYENKWYIDSKEYHGWSVDKLVQYLIMH
eukprot:28353_1